jgi:hypothetical protein
MCCSWGLLDSWTNHQMKMIVVIAVRPLPCFFCELLQQRFCALKTKSCSSTSIEFSDMVKADIRSIVFMASPSASVSANTNS